MCREEDRKTVAKMTCKRVLVLDYNKIEKVSILVVDSHINAGWQLQRKTAVWNPSVLRLRLHEAS
jgi:hypothetical protein